KERVRIHLEVGKTPGRESLRAVREIIVVALPRNEDRRGRERRPRSQLHVLDQLVVRLEEIVGLVSPVERVQPSVPRRVARDEAVQGGAGARGGGGGEVLAD